MRVGPLEIDDFGYVTRTDDPGPDDDLVVVRFGHIDTLCSYDFPPEIRPEFDRIEADWRDSMRSNEQDEGLRTYRTQQMSK